MQLFLDCDGVLADFDKRYHQLAGTPSREYESTHGADNFWDIVNRDEEFFYNLELMPDALELVDAVRHLDPIILTGGSTKTDAHRTKEQKERWAALHFPGVPVIVTRSAIKYQAMHPEKHNILIDDWTEYKHVWEENGGTFIHHTSARDSISQLNDLLRIRSF